MAAIIRTQSVRNHKCSPQLSPCVSFPRFFFRPPILFHFFFFASDKIKGENKSKHGATKCILICINYLLIGHGQNVRTNSGIGTKIAAIAELRTDLIRPPHSFATKLANLSGLNRCNLPPFDDLLTGIFDTARCGH